MADSTQTTPTSDPDATLPSLATGDDPAAVPAEPTGSGDGTAVENAPEPPSGGPLPGPDATAVDNGAPATLAGEGRRR